MSLEQTANCHCGQHSKLKTKDGRMVCTSCYSVLWQSIETAPRDGTDVLVWCGGAMFIACMDVGRWFFDRTDHSVKPLPTHWMPLPPLPKKGNE